MRMHAQIRSGRAPAARRRPSSSRPSLSRFANRAQELLRALMLRGSEELLRWRLFNDLALRKETHAVREFLGESHLVSHHQHGEIVLVAQLSNHVQHFTA